MQMISMLIMDVDGTLTDGTIYMGSEGEVYKAFNVKDGYAIANLLPQKNIIPVIITGRYSQIVQMRAKELNITEVYQNVSNKKELLEMLKEKKEIRMSEIAYIGDDINDLSCLELVGISGCPCDAADIVKNCVNYICVNAGGKGAVREFIDYIMKENI